jgi:hypothetical protein
MQGMRFTIPVHLHGTLSANAQGAFRLPCGATLAEVSACASNDSDATLQVGTSADADGVMTAAAIGDSSTPAVFGADDFDGALADGANPLHLADDTVVTWLLDYDGSSGTAGQNVDILFTFLEG